MTPQELDDARRVAADALRIPYRVDTIGILARAVLALTELAPLAEAASALTEYQSMPTPPTEVAIPVDPAPQRFLADPQPEPVSEDVLTTFLYDTALANLLNIDGDTPCVFAVELGRNFDITARPVATDEKPGA